MRQDVRWNAHWVRWSRATYGLIQSVDLAEQQGFGNFRSLEAALTNAAQWSRSSLGFNSAARRRGFRRESIRVRADQVDQLLELLKPATLDMLLIGTASVTEVLLAEILVARGISTRAPATLNAALGKLKSSLQANGTIARHAWAIDATHEMRIIRNCVVHNGGRWSEKAARDLHHAVGAKPIVGATVSASVDDLFAYRRAARTVLNVAARA